MVCCLHAPFNNLDRAGSGEGRDYRASNSQCKTVAVIKMFADDSLLFLKAEENNVRKALEIVQLFSSGS